MHLKFQVESHIHRQSEGSCRFGLFHEVEVSPGPLPSDKASLYGSLLEEFLLLCTPAIGVRENYLGSVLELRPHVISCSFAQELLSTLQQVSKVISVNLQEWDWLAIYV